MGWVAPGRRLVRADDDDGREGMLARIPPPDAPVASAAGEEADLRVLMVAVVFGCLLFEFGFAAAH